MPRDIASLQESSAQRESRSEQSGPPVQPSEQNSLEAILQDYSHLQDYYVSELPSWKLIRFFEKAGLPSNTPVLAFIDTSVWRSGKNGVLFTQGGLYYTNDFVAGAGGSYFISYADIVTHAAPIVKNRYFYLGYDRLPKRGLIDFVGANTDLEEFSSLIREIQSNYTQDKQLTESSEPRFLFDTAN